MQEHDPNKWSPRERVCYLLDHWSDIFEPNVASSLSTQRGGSGLDPRLPLMAHDPSVVELQRCISLLPKTHRHHLMAYRAHADWRQRKAKIRYRGPHGRVVESEGWEKQRIVPSWVRMDVVSDAESLLMKLFRGQVFIPKALWDGLTRVQG